MTKKRFYLHTDQIRELAPGHGSCIATDMITVLGRRIGYAYREQPTDDIDSGWRFFAGEESQAYADDPGNYGIYDVNTICNYDPEIIPLLNAPVGSAFERHEATGAFVPAVPPESE
jgi:hypothetical protein